MDLLAAQKATLSSARMSLLTIFDRSFYMSRTKRYVEMCGAIDRMQMDEPSSIALKRWAKLECKQPQGEPQLANKD